MNGQTFTGQNFKASCFYVPQYDKNWQHLTCIQVLSFAGKLFNSCPNDCLDATVQKTLENMGLVDAGHTKCSGLSGGQARRLSLGIALLKKPRILFLDGKFYMLFVDWQMGCTSCVVLFSMYLQTSASISMYSLFYVYIPSITYPTEVTSGLDSAASYQVCDVLSKVVAQRNLIVICTIHQPSTAVFEKFNELLLLSKGSVAYAGCRDDAEEHFAELGYPLPEHTNPSEHFM